MHLEDLIYTISHLKTGQDLNWQSLNLIKQLYDWFLIYNNVPLL